MVVHLDKQQKQRLINTSTSSFAPIEETFMSEYTHVLNDEKRHRKGAYAKKVICVTDGNKFASIEAAASYYGLMHSTICESVKRNKPVYSQRKNRQYLFRLA